MQTRPRREMMRGQALAEFLVISLVLIPLFLLLPVIGKLQDISHATQMASRYAAFDAVLRDVGKNSHKPPAQLATEVRQRYFGMPDAGIRSREEESVALREYWNDPFGNALIRKPEDIALSFGASHGDAHADGYSSASDSSLFPLARLASLSGRGIYRANVAVTVANLPAGLRSVEPFDRLNLTMERYASVLPDAWTASSPVQAEQRFGGLAPLNEAMPQDLVSTAVMFVELGHVPPPNFGKLVSWRDVVPQDRVRAGKQR